MWPHCPLPIVDPALEEVDAQPKMVSQGHSGFVDISAKVLRAEWTCSGKPYKHLLGTSFISFGFCPRFLATVGQTS